MTDELPPHSIEAERALLGSLLMLGTEKPSVIEDAAYRLAGADDFYLQHHADLYRGILSCYRQRGALDSVLLVETLRAQGVWDSIGGPQDAKDYVIELCEQLPTGVNAPHYAAIVADRARRRRFLSWLARARDAAMDELGTDMAELVERVRSDLDKAIGQQEREPA